MHGLHEADKGGDNLVVAAHLAPAEPAEQRAGSAHRCSAERDPHVDRAVSNRQKVSGVGYPAGQPVPPTAFFLELAHAASQGRSDEMAAECAQQYAEIVASPAGLPPPPP